MLTRRTLALAPLLYTAACAARPKDQPMTPIVEFRQYTLHPGQRDVLIDLFEREFIESQEAHGMRILGTFRDLDDADRFVWIRGFVDMEQRREALRAFYGGPVWRAQREAANATMVDSTNVLLLHPVGQIAFSGSDRPPPGAREIPPSLFITTIYPLAVGSASDFARFFGSDLKPLIDREGGDFVGAFATEHSENTFPALPVRENETVFATLRRFDNLSAYDGRRIPTDEAVERHLEQCVIARPQVLRLQPTARSLLR